MSNQTILSPSVYWAQTDDQLTLKIDLRDSQDPEVDIKSDSISFKGNGIGACGLNNYKFSLNLYSSVVPEESTYKVHDSKIDIIIKKSEERFWPRITPQPQKPHWLKVDFERWLSEDDLDDEPPRDIMQDYPGMYEKLEKEERGYMKELKQKCYVFVLNVLQVIGYLYILAVLLIDYLRDGETSMQFAYHTAGWAIIYCAALQFLDLINVYIGYTKGDKLLTTLQVLDRNFVLFVIVKSQPHHREVYYLLITLSVMEIIRFLYNVSKLIKKNYFILKWLNSILWIPLCISVAFQAKLALLSIPHMEKTDDFSILLPNSLNFEFYMSTFLKIYLILLPIPFISMLFMICFGAWKSRSNRRKINVD